MLRNIVFHTLKGKCSNNYGQNNIDVSYVINMHCRKRSFMIFDRKYPYTLYLSYKQYPSLFIYNNRTLTNRYHYKTEKECLDDLTLIIDKQNKLKIYTKEICDDILKK